MKKPPLCACTSSCWNLDIDLPVHTSATQGEGEVRVEYHVQASRTRAETQIAPKRRALSPDRACERAVLGCVYSTTNEIDTVETLRTRCPCSHQLLDGSTKRTRLDAGGCIRSFMQNTEQRTTRHTRYEIRDGDHSRYPRYTDMMDPASLTQFSSPPLYNQPRDSTDPSWSSHGHTSSESIRLEA